MAEAIDEIVAVGVRGDAGNGGMWASDRICGVENSAVFIEHVEAIESAFVAQWAHFGQGPAGHFHDEDGMTWIEAPVRELPYNAVVRTHLVNDIDFRIDETIARYRDRGVQFMWLVHPSSQPSDLAARLARRGLALVERGTGMALQLAEREQSGITDEGPITYGEVRDDEGMDVYEELIREYWELSPPSQRYVNGINRWAHGQGHGARWIALKDGMPVGKAYLSYTVGADALAVSSEIAGIFGVYVRPSARGYGIASALTARLIEQAADLGRKLVVLHSSDMALPLYLRMGFTARCPFLVYATTELHSIQPS